MNTNETNQFSNNASNTTQTPVKLLFDYANKKSTMLEFVYVIAICEKL